MDERSEILFENAVKHLGLAIGFQVISGIVSELGGTKAEEFAPKCTEEDGIAIGNQTTGEAMELAYYV